MANEQLTTLAGMKLQKIVVDAQATDITGMVMLSTKQLDPSVFKVDVAEVAGMILRANKPRAIVTTLTGMKLVNKKDRVVLPPTGAYLQIRCY